MDVLLRHPESDICWMLLWKIHLGSISVFFASLQFTWLVNLCSYDWWAIFFLYGSVFPWASEDKLTDKHTNHRCLTMLPETWVKPYQTDCGIQHVGYIILPVVWSWACECSIQDWTYCQIRQLLALTTAMETLWHSEFPLHESNDSDFSIIGIVNCAGNTISRV